MDLLPPGGRLLNHAIASVRPLPPASKDQSGFIDRYIFPDGEVVTLSTTLDALERVGRPRLPRRPARGPASPAPSLPSAESSRGATIQPGL
jgi:hypothetical protein